MPELPEVEVVRRGLEAHVLNQPIASVEVLHPRPVRRHLAGPDDFARSLTGRSFVAARRRGKYLWLALDDGDTGDCLLVHLGMSGQMLVQPPDAPAERHLRVRFGLSEVEEREAEVEGREREVEGREAEVEGREAEVEGREAEVEGREAEVEEREAEVEEPRSGVTKPIELRFVDQRMFGGLSISEGGAELPPEIAHIALDPLDPVFDAEAVIARIRRSSSGIKRILLNQSVISGVGNIYADEALWRSQIHGERAGSALTRPQLRDLLGHVHAVMTSALAQGGTSFDALYVNVNGESGYFDRSLDAYGQEGRPCGRCGTEIRRVAFMNRSSFFCPTCQKPPRGR